MCVCVSVCVRQQGGRVFDHFFDNSCDSDSRQCRWKASLTVVLVSVGGGWRAEVPCAALIYTAHGGVFGTSVLYLYLISHIEALCSCKPNTNPGQEIDFRHCILLYFGLDKYSVRQILCDDYKKLLKNIIVFFILIIIMVKLCDKVVFNNNRI